MTRSEIISANPIEDFVRNRGHELKRAGENFVTSGCPVTQHKNYHRPVTIDIAKNLWHCNDCKAGGSVIDWIMREKNVAAADAMRMLSGGNNGSAEIVATYDYVDEAGKLSFQCLRYQPKDFKQRQPDGKGGWNWNLKGVQPMLYHLPEVKGAETVMVVEGEKDADNLRLLGFVATTNPFGAGKWRDEYSETLRGKNAVIFFDGDEPDEKGKRAGQDHAQQIIESLHGKAKSIKLVELPDQFHDVSDYIESLPTDAATGVIAELADNTPEIEVKSFISSPRDDEIKAEDDFPKPPDEAAFYGLAGDLVRRLEPHTEADRTALLAHYLTAFGNGVGRSLHAVADGSRHGTNIYCVCAGESSKSRKGTSAAHNKRIFKRADPGWGSECVTSGLSSGEGLIYTVRDPVTKRVKQKGGRYKAEIVDDGVSDKRRLFMESEFAGTLRVMGREGNTLSAVVRQAWEDGDLRTAVKNSPNVATGAHISVIAHVTRDEVRRELCATDQANGFANRFLWIAVRRSKCLPEGGNLDDDNLNDLVMQTHEAIEFARSAGLVTRDQDARKLWCEVYPELSEGKPGLLGAIIARAEAQVLRLSCIYALLDLSTIVRPEHLWAALALWNYCERSAGWIFGTATGDVNADRILAALRATGREGLTRTDISHGLFQRNIKPTSLDSGRAPLPVAPIPGSRALWPNAMRLRPNERLSRWVTIPAGAKMQSS